MKSLNCLWRNRTINGTYDPDEQTPQFSIGGPNKNLEYRLNVIASRDTGTAQATIFTVTDGGAVTSQSITANSNNTFTNTSKQALLSGLTPDVEGTIHLRLDEVNPADPLSYAYINAFILESTLLSLELLTRMSRNL